jgi:hypothetical protein
MHPIIQRLIAAAVLLAAIPALAADNTLLIQIAETGKYRVWHTEGDSAINEDEAVALAISARPEGGEKLPTSAGLASAVETKNGVVVTLHDKQRDKVLLIDRDDCGGVKLWHGEGTTSLSDEQLTELVLTALPAGGERLTIGENFARGYTTRLGVIALLWKPVRR